MSLQKKFWNERILSWEEKKYQNKSQFLDVNSSVKSRLQLSAVLLPKVWKGKRLLELGCGSGKLWELTKGSDFASWTAVDFSETAISAFQNKAQNSPKRDKTYLYCEDCIENIYPADIVFSLGLLDWLDEGQIKQLAEHYKNKWYFHSFSQKNLSFSQAAHTLYSLINYKPGAYFPKYRKVEDLLNIFGSHAKIYSHPKLSFSTFIYSLPQGVDFKC